MTNEELQKLERAYIKFNTQEDADLKIYASESYVTSRRINETVTLQCQHSFEPDLWIVEHKDGTEGIYHCDELVKSA